MATNDPSVMARAIHPVPPSIDICSHSQLHPHSRSTSTKVVELGGSCASLAMDMMRKTPGCTSSNKQILPRITLCNITLFVYGLSFLVVFR